MNKGPWHRTAMWLILPALFAGCVDQKREVALYQKQLDSLPGATVPLVPDISPLSLQQALRLAELNNESLGLSGESYVQALIAKDRAYDTFLPTLSLNPTLTQTQRFHGQGPSHVFDLPADLNLNLFNGFRDEATIDQSTYTTEQQRQLLLNEQQTVLLDVVSTYYKVLQSERQVVVLQNSLVQQEELVRQSEAKLRFGNGTILDVAQSKAQASATRVSLIQAQTNVKTSRAMLAFLIGAPTETRTLSDGYTPPPVQPAMDVWLTQAQKNRQDLLAAASAVEAARQAVRIAIGEYYPSVQLNLNYLLYQEFPAGPRLLTSTISANIPLFTAGQVEADVRNAFSLLRAAVLTDRQTLKQVRQDINVNYDDLQNDLQQIDELRIEVVASRDALVQAQLQFNVGLATHLDILTAQSNLLNAQLQLATADYQEKIDYLSLLRVTGELNLTQTTPSTAPTTEPFDNLETTTPDLSGPLNSPAPR